MNRHAQGRIRLERAVCGKAAFALALLLPAGITSADIAATAPASPAPSLTLQQVAERQATPEAGTGRYPLSVAEAGAKLVVSAHPLATETAVAMLRRGGSAVDALIAAQLVLGLVEPQSSGLGGGGFLLHARAGTVTSLDGRERAPATATPERFLGADGQPLAFDAALANARAVGVPGLPALLGEAHARWGRLPWAELLAPAIALAERGAPVSDRLHRLSAADRLLAAQPATRRHFFDDAGKPWPVGHALRWPAQAGLLRTLARDGAGAFYRGPLAASLVQGLQAAGSDLTLDDWSGYRVRAQPALCLALGSWRGCSTPPPSGGLTVLQGTAHWLAAEAQAQGATRLTPHLRHGDLPAASLHRLLEAERLAFADRQRYSADPASVPVPVQGLIADEYLADRARLIGPLRLPRVEAGSPAGAVLAATDRQLIEFGTTHLAVADATGDWVALTSSIEDAFGSRLMVNGLLMNNQLTDFSFAPVQDGLPVANRVQPGKRPRSAMSPVLVLDGDGRPLLSLGSPGGSRILGFNTRLLSAWLAGLQDAGALVQLPHALSRNDRSEVEPGLSASLREALEARGHRLQVGEMTSGSSVILRLPSGRLQGAADPRREGRAAGLD